MASISNKGVQRGNVAGMGGQKKRSPTWPSHMGSRVEPSHVTEAARAEQAKTAAKVEASAAAAVDGTAAKKPAVSKPFKKTRVKQSR